MLILLIEDSEADAEILTRHLTKRGHVCTVVSSLEAVTDVNPSAFDFAITDLHIGASEPKETLAVVEALGIPYVVLTGVKDEQVMEEVGRHQVGLTIKHMEDMEAVAAYAIGQAEAAKAEQDKISKAAKVFQRTDSIDEG